MSATDFQGEDDFQGNALAVVEESLEPQRQPEGAAFHAGPVEHSLGARVVLKGSLSTILDLQAAVARPTTPVQVDPLGDAVEAGAIQEIRADAAEPSRRDPPVDQDPTFQRSGRRNEQQDQVNQPPLVRVPNSRELHCSHLSLLRPPPASRRALITLLG